MTDRRPEPGSPWERHCPDAWPREWLDRGEMPAGFSRPATPDEADLITGRIAESVFVKRRGKAEAPSSSPSKRSARPKRKRNPLVEKVEGWNRFLDGIRDRDPCLHPLAVAVWCWLWRCEGKGFARASERKLAARFRVGRNSIRAALRSLADAGYVSVARRGVHGRSSTVYRIRATPRKTRLDSAPKPGETGSMTGSETIPVPGPG